MTEYLHMADKGHALSPQQARVAGIKTYLSEGGNSVQNVYCCWRINGTVNINTLQHALSVVTDRWEIIRTNYVRPAGFKEPLQVIQDQAAVTIEIVPLGNSGVDVVADLVAKKGVESFSLDTDVMLRVYLYQHDSGESHLQLVAPALSFDVTGLESLVTQISLYYQGRQLKEKDEIIQFVDVANWLNELHQSDEFGQEQEYWHKQPETTPPSQLRLANSKDVSGSYRQKLIKQDNGSVKQLQALVTRYGVSEQSLLFTVWQCLLASYSDWEQLKIAIAVEERQDELQDFVGLLCCYLPIVASYTDAPLLSTLLKDNHLRIANHLEYREHFNWRSVVSDVQPNLARYGFSCSHHQQIAFGSMYAELIGSTGVMDLFDLQLNCVFNSTGLGMALSYDTGIFDDEAINLIAARFEHLLHGFFALLTDDPQASVNELNCISYYEKQLIADSMTWEDAAIAVPAHQLFTDIAIQTPDKIALETENNRFSYGELNHRAEQLAGYLQAQGIVPGMPVAVCTARDEYLIISLLAILKVGGIYVPLDPHLQAQRINYIIDDTACQWVLTVAEHEETANKLATAIVLDKVNVNLAIFTPVVVNPEQLAYLIYTSGSTGNPKGVGVSHSALFQYVSTVDQRLRLSSNASMLALASVATDLGHTALFVALLMGRTLRLLLEDKAMDASSLVQHLESNPVSCLKIVPSHLRALLSVSDPARILPTECLVLGGEALPAALIAHIRTLKPGLRIVNHYGPTETTVGILTHEVARQDYVTYPVGRPLSGAQAFVVNEQGNLAGVGVVGELYLGGKALAEGYWNRGDLTAERFVPDDFSGLIGKRLYRSGDLAFYRADGELVYVGRCDHQVKVRGFRVELGEIEATLCRFPQVSESVVLLQTVEPNASSSSNVRNELVAHVVVVNDQQLDIAAMQVFLEQHLPEYMIPAVIQPIKKLPLTRSGKVDRKALPRVMRESSSQVAWQAPQTEIEIILVDLWQSLLGIERIGVNDNFFAIGGDSIVSIQLAARLNQLGFDLMPKQIFDNRTIAQLAQVIVKSGSVVIDQGAVTGDFPLTPIQKRYFEFSDTVEQSHYNQAMMFDLDKNVSFEQVTAVINALTKHHDIFRTHYEVSERDVRQYIPTKTENVVTQKVILAPDETHSIEQQQKIIIEQVQASLDITQGLNTRVVMFEFAASEKKQLLICLHHLLVDGISWRILIEDINIGLQQCATGDAIQFADKTSSFKDWANYQLIRAKSEFITQQCDFWLGQKTTMVMPVELICNPGDNTIAHASQVEMRLDSDHTSSLLQNVNATYNTQINDILLAALSMAYTQWSGNAELVVELEGHGRENDNSQVNITRTVGWFTSRYPLKLAFASHSKDICTHIITTKELIRAVPDKGIGYGLLRYLSDDSSLRETLTNAASNSISFNYLGQFNDRRTVNALALPCVQEVPGSIGSRHARTHNISINGLIQSGQLVFSLIYSDKMYSAATIQHMADLLRQNLIAIIDHCQLPESGSYTASDFPLAQLSQEKMSRLIANYQLTPGTVDDLYPVTPLQHGMLFETQLNPGAGVNMLQMDSTLVGELSVEAWRASWQSQINRHSIFRTAFIDWSGDTPLQYVQSTVDVPWHYEDWSNRSDVQKQSGYATLLEQERTWKFDFERAPLMRLVLVKWSENSHKFIWTRHHALLDGWSSANVLQEVLVSYELIRVNNPVSLAPVVPYRDYIAWLQQRMQDQGDKEYWRRYLKGFSSSTPITKSKNWQIAKNQDKAHYSELDLSETLSEHIRAFAKKHQYTPGLVLQAAWGLLLSRYSHLSDVVFGSVVSGRPPSLRGVESIVGPSINTVPTRVKINYQKSIHELIESIQLSNAERDDYCYTPLNIIQQLSNIAVGEPLFSSLFVIQNFVTKSQLEQIEKEKQKSTIELITAPTSYRMSYPLTCFVTLTEQINIRLYYDAENIDNVVVDAFGVGLQDVLGFIINSDMQTIANYQLNCLPAMDLQGESSVLVSKNDASVAKTKICVASTFTPESVEEPLNFWINEMSLNAELHIAPYGQLFQQLMDEHSIIRENRDGLNVLLIKLDDWFGVSKIEANMQVEMQKNANEFIAVLNTFAHQGQCPFLIVLTPCAPTIYADSKVGDWIIEQENEFVKTLSQLPDIYVLPYQMVNQWYQVDNYYDPQLDKLAHIPYVGEYTSALGASICRRYHAISRLPYKVLMVDCDNTLWGGVCGEVGVDGIVLDDGYLALQKKIVELNEKGLLVCLCSKNDEADVLAVFEKRKDMLLSLDHVVARKINWQAKSTNIQDLAIELNLGMDSFIFIDDDDVQCADVQLNCPAVTVLQVPKNSSDISAYINHIWVFDVPDTGSSNLMRTQLYKDNQLRQKNQSQFTSLHSFIESLELDIQIDEVQTGDISRVSELLLRTNQFNFTVKRHTQAQLTHWLQCAHMQGLVVRVSDRFGDYGLVGAVLYQVNQEILDIDSMLLSCRALGRGVEHRMLQELGLIAQRANLAAIKLNFVPSEKNTPARNFINEIIDGVVSIDSESSWLVDVQMAVATQLKPEIRQSQESIEKPMDVASSNIESKRDIANNKQFDYIARSLDTIAKIDAKANQNNKPKNVQRADTYLPPQTGTELYLAQLWSEILVVQNIGLGDHFFQIGGHSLVATRILSQVCNHYDIELSLASLFESPILGDFSKIVETAISLADNTKEKVRYQYSEGDIIYSLPNRQILFNGPHQHHWNIAGICQIRNANAEYLELALKQMLEVHQGLRHRFYLQDSQLVGESVMSIDEVAGLDRVDLSGLPNDDEKISQLEFLANEYQFGFDLGSSLYKFVLFEMGGDQPARFLWITHHALMDAPSRSLFFGELMTRYLSLVAGAIVERPAFYRADSVIELGYALHQYANEPHSVEKELNYWNTLPWKNISLLADNKQGIVDNKSNNVALYGNNLDTTKYLDRNESQRLLDPGWLSQGVGIADLVFYAFSKAIATVNDNDCVYFDTVASGRDCLGYGIDVAQTIGWFSEYRPVVITVDRQLSVEQQVLSCKQQMVHISAMGSGFNAVKWLNDEASIRNQFQQLPEAEFLLNYLPPQLTASVSGPSVKLPWELISSASENVGETGDPEPHCIVHPSYVAIRLDSDRFCITWSARDNIYKVETLNRLTDLWVSEMKQTIDLFCR